MTGPQVDSKGVTPSAFDDGGAPLMALLQRISAELPDLADGSHELREAHYNLTKHPQDAGAAGLPAAAAVSLTDRRDRPRRPSARQLGIGRSGGDSGHEGGGE